MDGFVEAMHSRTWVRNENNDMKLDALITDLLRGYRYRSSADHTTQQIVRS